jgi:glycosyltransferase involved in cell wall biosynthesis
VTICFIESPPEKQTGGLNAAISSLRGALRAHGVEIVGEPALSRAQAAHFHGLWQPRHSALSRELRKRKVPFVISPHGMLEPWAWKHKRWKKLPYFYLRERTHLASANCLLATGAFEAQRLREFFPRANICALPLGLTGEATPDYASARQHLDWRANERVLLFLSRVHPKKGLDLLLHALAQALPGCLTRENTRLVIVGGGEADYIAELRGFCEKHTAELPRVKWAGEIWGDARWPYFQGADLFCLPSHSENFGLAVLEACQVGTPVLTTTTTPWAGELGNDRGFICDPNLASIRSALERFFAKPLAGALDRKALSNWAWEKFHWRVLVPRYVELYRSLIKH